MSTTTGTPSPTHFDDNARRWDENPVFQERGLKMAQTIQSMVSLDKTMTVLDYGCGTGLLSFPLKDALGEITMADSSEGMLAVLREKIAAQGVKNMHPTKLDLLTDAPPAARFNLIYTSMTLHHIPDIGHILDVFHDLLVPGGSLCIADLDKEDGSFHGPGFDVHPGFEREALEMTSKAHGFSDIHFDTVFEIVKERDNGSQTYPVFMMRAKRS